MTFDFLTSPEDRAQLSAWWVAKGLPEVPPEFHSPSGYIVRLPSGELACGAWLLHTDTGVAGIGNISGNPALPKEVRGEALDFLIEGLARQAKLAGYVLLTASTNVPALKNRYERLLFRKTDENVTCYGRIL